MIRVKICGITRADDALLAAELGASAVGFIFYPPSPRFVSARQAAAIARELPPFVTTVGVFINPGVEQVQAVLDQVPLNWIQLHGDESPEFCTRLDRPVLKAFRVGPNFDLERLKDYSVSAYLLDGFDPGRLGGAGKTFDWPVARQARRYGAVVIAGGITPENLARAVAVAQPDAVDVSSGVESEPGKKDPTKLRRLFDVNRHLEPVGAGPA